MINETEIIELIKRAEEVPTLDYKKDLPLAKDGDKAEFVKDVIALANSGTVAHLIVGVEDSTGRPVGFNTSHTAEQINQILKDKCDPPISVEYTEKNILGYQIGVIEIKGDSSPYIVSVPDKFGGKLSSNPNKSFHIQRGTVYVRNYNMNQGAKRADLDTMYDRIKYVSLQADLQLSHKVTTKPLDSLTEVSINYFLTNLGDVIAADTLVWLQFTNVKKIVNCRPPCQDMSKANEDIPTIGFHMNVPIVSPIRTHCGGVIVEVEQGIEQVEAKVIIGATNMRTKEGPYIVSLKEHKP